MTAKTQAKHLAAIIVALSATQCLAQDAADQVFDRIVENWRWSHFWFGKTGVDDVYAEGKKISALMFWTKTDTQPMRGLCSTDLALCVAYTGMYLDPRERRTRMAPNISPQQAFASWINRGLQDPSALIGVPGLSPAEFNVQEKTVTLPPLLPPTSIQNRVVPNGAMREAERIRQWSRCGGPHTEVRPGCSGTLVFAYYGNNDPYWFVLRSCTSACEFKGDSIQMLTRGDYHWEATSGGYIERKDEVERLKQQVEKAEMFRFAIK